MAKKTMKKDGMHRMPDGTMMKNSDMKKEEMSKDKATGLTDAQKKLPPALQAAILKKMKKK
jgi:hypothetical protein